MLWGQQVPADEKRGLQTTISRLRGLLGAGIVTKSACGYLLRCRREQVDALRFAELAAIPPGDEHERIRLEQARSLWRGTPFHGIDSPRLVELELPRITETYLAVLDRRADFAIAEQRDSEVLLADLQEACAHHALRETTWARWLLVLGRSGRREEALDRYEEVRARMADQLGADPGPELQAARAELLAAGGMGAVVTSNRAAVPRQLPANVVRFIGRAAELTRLDRSLADGRPRAPMIAAIHGTGGVGKTAFAVHWAHQAARLFPDGQMYVDLRGYAPADRPRSAAEALDLLLLGIGFEGNLVPSDLDGRSALWRTALSGRRVLLLLDNARDAGQVRPLLPDRGSSLVLVTSRDQLRSLSSPRRVERIVLDRLAAEESRELVSRNLEAEGIRWPAASVAELAALCADLPLALAIASEHAVRDPAGSGEELLDWLRDEQDRLDALETGGDPLASVRAVLTASYEVLDTEAARTYRLIGSHPSADLGVPAAAALTGTTCAVARSLLDRLQNMHLVQEREPGRYSMHDLVRIHAIEQSARLPADRDLALLRVFDWYLRSALNARAQMGFPELPTDFDEPQAGVLPATFELASDASGWFDQERSALAATVHAASRAEHPAAYRITQAANGYLFHRGMLDELFRLHHLAISVAEKLSDSCAVALSLNQLGNVHNRLGKHGLAKLHFERALDLFEGVGNIRGQSSVLSNLGSTLRMLGRADSAVRRHRTAIEIGRLLDDPAEEGSSWNNLAMSYVELGAYEAASDTAQKAIELCEVAGNQCYVSFARDTLGQALAGQGRYAEAMLEFGQAISFASAAGDQWHECTTLAQAATAQAGAGLIVEARRSVLQALEILDEIGGGDTGELRRDDLKTLLATLPDS
ncbi:tetratricopeptide repeat protein [Streptomyces sp. SID13031]|uniref:AfsR/SARP family transcriptional regulator n=1 Tax=Streptomyces sp. SID13031 TaxID=2706046 RepID=UPI001EF3CD35|nr:tetratricopeptide repeat protein [Streptomyces sp. SID13031]